jgi:hypothetical protein
MPVATVAAGDISSGIPDAENQVYTTGVSGSDLVANGAFDDTSAWTLGAGWAIGSGTLNRTPGSATNAFQTIAITAGRAYRVEFDVSGRTAGGVSCFLGGDNISGSLTANTTHSFDVAAGSSDSLLLFRDDGAFDGSIDAVSVRELTHYSVGDQVWYAGHVWQSLTNDNYNNTPVEGANWTDRGEIDEGADKWTAGTYALDAYKVHNGRLWKSTKNSNTSEPGVTNDVDWTDFGATQRLRPFNGFIQQPASFTTEMSWTFTVAARVTHLVIFAPRAGTVRVVGKRPSDSAVVYDDTQFATRTSRSFYAYHWSPISRKSSLIFEAIPSYSGMEFTVTFSSGAGNAISVGAICCGFATPRATVTTGSGLGIESRSIKETSISGVPNIVPFSPSRIVSFQVIADIGESDDIYNTLSDLEATPSVYFMKNGGDYGLVTYGLFDDFFLTFPNSVKSEFILEIRGFAEND